MNMENLNLTARKILAFIPSGAGYEKAIQFYKEIGFIAGPYTDSFTVFRKDECRFILQNYQNEWALGNYMMVLEVENLDDWWTMLKGLELEKKYDNVKVTAPELYPWGKREIHLVDTCGVLWHIS